ncbi:MAG: hypothetical protein ABIY70_08665 [Capsulimonas sp.]|uniref:hypothetical protein n=1 Tax=Capsulimonas sp. TaxID=2494211 RepID=UPI003266B028
MQIGEPVVIRGVVTGMWLSKPDTVPSFRAASAPETLMIRVRTPSGMIIDTPQANMTAAPLIPAADQTPITAPRKRPRRRPYNIDA